MGHNSAPIQDYAGLRPKYEVPAHVLQAGFVLLLGVGVVFSWTLAHLWQRWMDPKGYYSHGPWIIPIAVVTAWLIVRKRGLPMCSSAASRRLGLALILGGLVIHVASMYALVTFISGFMLLVVMLGIVLYIGGFPMFSRLWFPIAFLAFMVALPDVMIGDINFRLKLMAAELSTHAVGIFGVEALRSGSIILMEHGKQLMVDDVCSGLQSLVALLAFATLFTYICKLRGYKRLVLFLSAVPIAVAANVVRISVLVAVANYKSVEAASPGSFMHDSMGYLVFVVAFCMMFLEEEFLDMLPGARGGAWILSREKSAAKSTEREGR